MKELLLKCSPLLLGVALVGCGGSGDSSQRAPRIDASLGAGIAGPSAAPELKSVETSIDTSVEYNSVVTGKIEADSELVISFVAPANKKTLVRLTSTVPNADLYVTGSGVDLASTWGATSNELVVFEATQSGQYRIEIDGDADQDGTYTLIIAEANRSSAGLGSKEYLLEVENTRESKCTGTEGDNEYTSTYTSFQTISWQKGYIYWAADKLGFRNISGNKFEVEKTVSISENGDSWMNSIFSTMTVAAKTGVVTGTATTIDEAVENDEGEVFTERCVNEFKLAGKVIL